jgi:curli production assembly/transport component CsgG/holdfast attachment protein HfaB
MRLVNTNTLEVADGISTRKQTIGRQISAGLFSFLGTNFSDASAGVALRFPR